MKKNNLLTIIFSLLFSVYCQAQNKIVEGNLTVNGFLHSNNTMDGLSWNIFSNYHIAQNDRPGMGVKFKFGQFNSDHKWAGINAYSASSYSNTIGLDFYTKHHGENPSRKFRINSNGTIFANTLNTGLAWNTFANYHLAENDQPGIGIKFKFGQFNSDHKWAGIAAYSESAYSNTIGLNFYSKHHNENPSIKMRINTDGSVGIGTLTTGSHKLAVAGSIGAREIKVEITEWQDQVFYDDYDLLTLEEVEEHIDKKGHLPEIPSEAKVTENGINLGEMNAKLLQKIEELTLYLIEQNKEIKAVKKEIEQLKDK